jgi:magnesium-transporting ATPase (P-type)
VLRRSTIAISSPENPGDVYIYVKGAPEEVISLCGKHIIEEGETEMGQDEKDAQLNSIKQMAA